MAKLNFQLVYNINILLLFSSPHSFSCRVSGQRTGTAMVKYSFCASVTHLCVYFDVCFGLLFWSHYKISTEAVRFWFLSVCIWSNPWCMHLNKMFRTLAEKQAHNIKDPAVYINRGHGVLLSLFVLNSSGEFAAKKLFFQFQSDNRSQCRFEVPVVSDNWICWSLFLDEWGEFSLKPSRTTCVM